MPQQTKVYDDIAFDLHIENITLDDIQLSDLEEEEISTEDINETDLNAVQLKTFSTTGEEEVIREVASVEKSPMAAQEIEPVAFVEPDPLIDGTPYKSMTATVTGSETYTEVGEEQLGSTETLDIIDGTPEPEIPQEKPIPNPEERQGFDNSKALDKAYIPEMNEEIISIDGNALDEIVYGDEMPEPTNETSAEVQAEAVELQAVNEEIPVENAPAMEESIGDVPVVEPEAETPIEIEPVLEESPETIPAFSQDVEQISNEVAYSDENLELNVEPDILEDGSVEFTSEPTEEIRRVQTEEKARDNMEIDIIPDEPVTLSDSELGNIQVHEDQIDEIDTADKGLRDEDIVLLDDEQEITFTPLDSEETAVPTEPEEMVSAPDESLEVTTPITTDPNAAERITPVEEVGSEIEIQEIVEESKIIEMKESPEIEIHEHESEIHFAESPVMEMEQEEPVAESIQEVVDNARNAVEIEPTEVIEVEPEAAVLAAVGLEAAELEAPVEIAMEEVASDSAGVEATEVIEVEPDAAELEAPVEIAMEEVASDSAGVEATEVIEVEPDAAELEAPVEIAMEEVASDSAGVEATEVIEVEPDAAELEAPVEIAMEEVASDSAGVEATEVIEVEPEAAVSAAVGLEAAELEAPIEIEIPEAYSVSEEIEPVEVDTGVDELDAAPVEMVADIEIIDADEAIADMSAKELETAEVAEEELHPSMDMSQMEEEIEISQKEFEDIAEIEEDEEHGIEEIEFEEINVFEPQIQNPVEEIEQISRASMPDEEMIPGGTEQPEMVLETPLDDEEFATEAAPAKKMSNEPGEEPIEVAVEELGEIRTGLVSEEMVSPEMYDLREEEIAETQSAESIAVGNEGIHLSKERKEQIIDEKVDTLSIDTKDEIKKVLKYLDNLLEDLPEEKIKQFSQSEYYDLYVKILDKLGI